MKFGLALAMMVGAFGLASCSSGGDSVSDSHHSELTINGCKTVYDASSKADYCAQLQDDSLDHCGIASSRRSLFQASCDGTFTRSGDRAPVASATPTQRPPSVQQPVQPPVQTPIGQPTPKPAPSTPFEFLVDEFAGIGIKVTLDRQSGMRMHDAPDFSQSLRAAIPVLRSMKNEFAKRAGDITELTLGNYTTYNAKDLTLGVFLASNDLPHFLSLFDRQIALQKRTMVTVDYGIVSFDRTTDDEIKDYESRLDYFSAADVSTSLRLISPLVKTIDLTTSHYLKMYDSSYDLDEKSYDAEFRADLPLLKKMASLMSRGVGYSSYVNLAENHSALEKLIDLLNANGPGLATVAGLKNGMKVTVDIDSDSAPSFIGDELKIYVKNSVPDLGGLLALIDIAPLLRSQKIDLEMAGYDLDADFMKAAQKVKARSAVIASKKSLIKKIYVGGSTTNFSYGTLYVGTDTLADLDKALADVK